MASSTPTHPNLPQRQQYEHEKQASYDPNAGRRLLSSNYRIFNPVDVGDRFVTFLLRNERTMSELYHHVLMDHLGFVRRELGSGGNDNGSGNDNLPLNLDGLGLLSENHNLNHLAPNEMGTHENNNGNLPKEKAKRANASIEIDAFQLISLDPVLGNLTLRYPDTLLELLEDSTVQARQVLRGRIEVALGEGVKNLKKRLEIIEKGELQQPPSKKHDNIGASSNNKSNNPHNPNNSIPITHNIQNLQKQLKTMTLLHHSLQSTSRQQHLYDPRPLHARLVHLPPHHQCCKPTLSSITSADVGTVVQISGTCVRTGPVRMMETVRYYVCLGKGCGHRFAVTADFGTTNNALPSPTVCPRADEGDCTSTAFAIVPNLSEHADYQELKVQESVSALSRVGSIPRSILIKLTDDLVDKCNPGDEVVVVGSLHAEWQARNALGSGLEVMVGMSMRAHSVRVINADQEFGGGMGGTGSSSIIDLNAMASGGTAAALAASSGNLREKFRREFDAFWSDPGAKRRPIATRDYILRAVCPKLYGMHAVKLGLLLVLIGGATVSSEGDFAFDEDQELVKDANGVKNDMDGSDDEEAGPVAFKIGDDQDEGDRVEHKHAKSKKQKSNNQRGKAVRSRRRTQSHILLIGDPGTGKSQFLRFAAALSPRSVLTTGTGSSTAGLTCAAVRDQSSGSSGNEFSLEAGALALADRGVCCIDEFGCMSKEDRTSIHEAMEQQTISVAKAGIIAKLNARATVVAVMNPHGGIYDDTQSLQQNSRLGSALLSRFDLIFKMIDQSQTERDANIANFLLQQSIIPGSGYDRPVDIETLFDDDRVDGHWGMEKLRAYIATVREQFHPTLTPEASELLENHYSYCRQVSGETGDNKIPITVRFLESLIRLSQAHARLMYRNKVTLQDAAAIVLLMECSANSTYDMLGGASGYYARENMDMDDFVYTNAIETEFRPFERADAIFENECQALLRRYGKKGNDHHDDDIGGDGGFGYYDGRNHHFPADNRKSKSWDDVVPREPRYASYDQSDGNGASQKDQWGRQMLSQVANSPQPSRTPTRSAAQYSSMSRRAKNDVIIPQPSQRSSQEMEKAVTFSTGTSFSQPQYHQLQMGPTNMQYASQGCDNRGECHYEATSQQSQFSVYDSGNGLHPQNQEIQQSKMRTSQQTQQHQKKPSCANRSSTDIDQFTALNSSSGRRQDVNIVSHSSKSSNLADFSQFSAGISQDGSLTSSSEKRRSKKRRTAD